MEVLPILKRGAVVIIAVAAGISFGLEIRSAAYKTDTRIATEQKIAVSPVASPVSAGLTVPDLLSRSYGGSVIISNEDLGQRDGYRLQRIGFYSDGLKEYALQATPNSKQPFFGYPLVVVAHGFDDPAKFNTDNTAYSNFMSEYAKRGMIAVLPDYRGHRGSEGKAESGYFSSGYTVDVLNLLAVMKKQKTVNPREIGLVGYSLGGGVVLKSALADSDVKAVVILAGATGQLDDIVASGLPSEQSAMVDHSSKDKLISEYGQPTKSSDFWRQMAAINYVSELNAAVSLYHCADDGIVPVRFSDDLYAALQAAGKESNYYRCGSGGHGFGGMAESGILSQTAAFLENKLIKQ